MATTAPKFKTTVRRKLSESM